MTPDRVPTPPQLDTDEALRVLMQQIADLAERVHFLERALLPGVPAPTRFDSARAKAARTAGESLRPELESIGSALDSVMTSIEGNRSTPTPPPVEDVVVDLSTGRRTSPRPDPNRQSGWPPVRPKTRSSQTTGLHQALVVSSPAAMRLPGGLFVRPAKPDRTTGCYQPQVVSAAAPHEHVGESARGERNQAKLPMRLPGSGRYFRSCKQHVFTKHDWG